MKKEWKSYVMFGVNLLIVVLLFANFVLDGNRSFKLMEIECSLGLINCGINRQIISSQPNPLEGWEEECIEQEVITTDRFLVNINNESGIVGLEIVYNNNYWDRPVFSKTNKLQGSWNDTKCSKWMLVKKTPFNGK